MSVLVILGAWFINAILGRKQAFYIKQAPQKEVWLSCRVHVASIARTMIEGACARPEALFPARSPKRGA
jgi:hypothetical protein